MAKKSKKSKSSARRSQTEATLQFRRNWKPGAKVKLVNKAGTSLLKGTLKVMPVPKDEYRPLPADQWFALSHDAWEHYTRFVAA